MKTRYFGKNLALEQWKTGGAKMLFVAKQNHTNAVFQLGKGGFCSRFHAAVGIGSIAKRDVFCCALFDQVLNPCDQ